MELCHRKSSFQYPYNRQYIHQLTKQNKVDGRWRGGQEFELGQGHKGSGDRPLELIVGDIPKSNKIKIRTDESKKRMGVRRSEEEEGGERRTRWRGRRKQRSS